MTSCREEKAGPTSVSHSEKQNLHVLTGSIVGLLGLNHCCVHKPPPWTHSPSSSFTFNSPCCLCFGLRHVYFRRRLLSDRLNTASETNRGQFDHREYCTSWCLASQTNPAVESRSGLQRQASTWLMPDLPVAPLLSPHEPSGPSPESEALYFLLSNQPFSVLEATFGVLCGCRDRHSPVALSSQSAEHRLTLSLAARPTELSS